MATFGGNLRKLRVEAGFRTARQLAAALGVVPSVISKMENDQQGLPEGPTLLKLAKALRRSVDELLDGVDPDYRAPRSASSATPPDVDEAPRLDPKQAANLTARTRALVDNATAAADFVYEIDAPRATRNRERRGPADAGYDQSFAVVLRADSMEPLLKRGMRLLVSPTHSVNDGDLAYVHLKSGERLIKLVTRHRNGWWLSAANPAYPPRFVATAQISALHRVVLASFVR